MRAWLLSILVNLGFLAYGQSDTIVVSDFSKVMVMTNNRGMVQPVTDLSTVSEAGFFLNRDLDGLIRICHPEELSAWVDGQLVAQINNCETTPVSDFFRFTKSDTVFLALSTRNSLTDLTCELVVIEEFRVIEEVAQLKKTQAAFHEFVIIAVLTLLLFCASLMAYAPHRFFFIFKKTFSLNRRVHEFVSTSFLARANTIATLIMCLLIAFEIVYLSYYSGSNNDALFSTYTDYLNLWGRMSLIVFACFIGKYMLMNIVSKLFSFKDTPAIQFFDMVNFLSLFGYILLGLIILDFSITDAVNSMFAQLYIIVPLVLILYSVWFFFKFVVISLHRKLLLIPYLCATEIIPAIVLLSWLLE